MENDRIGATPSCCAAQRRPIDNQRQEVGSFLRKKFGLEMFRLMAPALYRWLAERILRRPSEEGG